MAKLKLYRCMNGHCRDKDGKAPEWWGDPVCPTCKTNEADPQFGGVITQLVILHFDPPSHVQGKGTGKLACDGRQAGEKGSRFTGNPTVVNCPACKTTEVFKKISSEWGMEDGIDEAWLTANAEDVHKMESHIASTVAAGPVAFEAAQTPAT